MNATARLHDLGQSLWLDNITRDLPEGYLRGIERRIDAGLNPASKRAALAKAS